jgi:Tol biopolymer transport system component
MRLFHILWLISLCFLGACAKIEDYPGANSSPTNNPTAFEHRGNIFIKDQTEKVTRLTSSGKDRAPLISPDGKNLVFLRKSKNIAIDDLSDGSPEHTGFADQIWIVDLSTGKETCLVSDEAEPGRQEVFTRERAYIYACRFSPDGSNLYFLASAAPVTSHIYVVDIRTHKDRYVTHASSLDVIYSGNYKGYLVFEQHQYWESLGSYDWYWLFTPEGKIVAPICNENEDWKSFGPLESVLGERLNAFVRFAINEGKKEDVKKIITELKPAFSNNAMYLLK